jgi:hypothetical protein
MHPTPDEIPFHLLNAIMASQIAPALTLLFQTSVDQGIVQDDCKTVNIIFCSRNETGSHRLVSAPDVGVQ